MKRCPPLPQGGFCRSRRRRSVFIRDEDLRRDQGRAVRGGSQFMVIQMDRYGGGVYRAAAIITPT